jgi:uncharacterized protein YegP (UPF0339 family)
MPISNLLAAGPPPATPPAVPPTAPPSYTRLASEPPARNPALTLIAGVGVLLLAMGIGVLIGRSSSSRTTAAPPEVITVGSPASTGAATPEASFIADWPSGKSGYTVQLEALPETGTTVSQVTSAKSAATGKGAAGVGALKSEEFTSLSAGSYIIYSGEYSSRAAAQKALGSLRKNFPAAKVIKVSNAEARTSGGEASSHGSKPVVKSSLSHPAPESSLKKIKSKGEKKSEELPEVVETG